MRENKKIRPWSFVRNGDLFFQLYDDGIDITQSIPSYISNLEYDFSASAAADFKNVGLLKKSSTGRDFIRLGLPVSMQRLETIDRYAQFLHLSAVLSRDVVGVLPNQIEEIIDLCAKAQAVLNGNITIAPALEHDFLELVNLLQSRTSVPLRDLGVEGSLCIGVSHADSDFDIVLYGEKNYKELLAFFSDAKQAVDGTRIEMFSNSEYGFGTIYEARKRYMPFSENEMINHESRKITGFIKSGDTHRKFSIVGILDSNDDMRKSYASKYRLTSRYTPLGVVTASGTVCCDLWGDFRPSIYDLEDVSFLEMPQSSFSRSISESIGYVIDNIGNYYSHCKTGEKIECRAMLEAEISTNGERTGQYRLHLNNWDNHIENRFYLKTKLDT